MPSISPLRTCASQQRGPEKLAINQVEEGCQHDRTPLLIEAIDSRCWFPDIFAAIENGFVDAADCFVSNRLAPCAGVAAQSFWSFKWEEMGGIVMAPRAGFEPATIRLTVAYRHFPQPLDPDSFLRVCIMKPLF